MGPRVSKCARFVSGSRLRQKTLISEYQSAGRDFRSHVIYRIARMETPQATGGYSRVCGGWHWSTLPSCAWHAWLVCAPIAQLPSSRLLAHKIRRYPLRTSECLVWACEGHARGQCCCCFKSGTVHDAPSCTPAYRCVHRCIHPPRRCLLVSCCVPRDIGMLEIADGHRRLTLFRAITHLISSPLPLTFSY